MIEIPVFILSFVLVLLVGCFPYYMSHMGPRFINDQHRQLIRDRDEARRQHKPTKHIINKIKALVLADLKKGYNLTNL